MIMCDSLLIKIGLKLFILDFSMNL
jgi:hypothetical protein